MAPHSLPNGWETSEAPSFLHRTSFEARGGDGQHRNSDPPQPETRGPRLEQLDSPEIKSVVAKTDPSVSRALDIGDTSSPRFRILVIHPQRHVADVLTTILAPLHLDCEHAEGEAELVRYVGQPIALLLAVGSPSDSSTLDLLAYSRRKQPWVQVIVLFTSPDGASASEALIRGAAAVLAYPCSPRELRAAVSESLHSPCPSCSPRCGCREFEDQVAEPSAIPPRQTPDGGRPGSPEVVELESSPVRPRELLPHNRECTCLGPLKEDLQIYERLLILRALRALDWDRQETAQVLRVHRSTLYHKMIKYGLC